MRNAAAAGQVQWRVHVLERLLERNLSRMQIIQAIQTGEVIEQYPDALPYPCALFHTVAEGRAVHVVAASDGAMVWVITAYEPDEQHFESDLKTRRKKRDG